MRRVLALSLLVGVLAGSAACGSADPATTSAPTSTTSATADATSDGPRTAACGAVKAARDAAAGDLLDAMMGTEENFDDAAMLAATTDALAALTTLGPAITAAAGQTTDAELKDALTAHAAAIGNTANELTAAGTDREKLDAVWAGAFSTTEKVVLGLCFDVWFP